MKSYYHQFLCNECSDNPSAIHIQHVHLYWCLNDFSLRQRCEAGGVGHGHVHYKALIKIIPQSAVLLSVDYDILYMDDCIYDR